MDGCMCVIFFSNTVSYITGWLCWKISPYVCAEEGIQEFLTATAGYLTFIIAATYGTDVQYRKTLIALHLMFVWLVRTENRADPTPPQVSITVAGSSKSCNYLPENNLAYVSRWKALRISKLSEVFPAYTSEAVPRFVTAYSTPSHRRRDKNTACCTRCCGNERTMRGCWRKQGHWKPLIAHAAVAVVLTLSIWREQRTVTGDIHVNTLRKTCTQGILMALFAKWS